MSLYSNTVHWTVLWTVHVGVDSPLSTGLSTQQDNTMCYTKHAGAQLVKDAAGRTRSSLQAMRGASAGRSARTSS